MRPLPTERQEPIIRTAQALPAVEPRVHLYRGTRRSVSNSRASSCVLRALSLVALRLRFLRLNLATAGDPILGRLPVPVCIVTPVASVNVTKPIMYVFETLSPAKGGYFFFKQKTAYEI